MYNSTLKREYLRKSILYLPRLSIMLCSYTITTQQTCEHPTPPPPPPPPLTLATRPEIEDDIFRMMCTLQKCDVPAL